MLQFDKLVVRQGDFSLKIDQSLKKGFVSIVGPSGSGKSTLLSAMAGFLPISDGRLLWNDNDISKSSPHQRPISMVFQDNNLFPHLSIRQNVALALEPKLKPSAATIVRVDEVLDQVGLAGMGDRKPAALSGGQQSRAALARVLLVNRPTVLLDEPFAALGPGLRSEMLQLVMTILKDKLVLMVTHDPMDARKLSGKTILVDGGQCDAARDTTELFENPPESLRKYLGQ